MHMSGVMTNSAISAKLKSMRSNLLTYDDYMQMAALESVAQVAAYLKSNTMYSSYLSNEDAENIHRESLEIHLKTALNDDFEKLYCFADMHLKEFLSKILMFHEAASINKVARNIYMNNHTAEELGEFLKRHIDVDMELLTKAEDLNGFVHSLSNTQYYKSLVFAEKSRKNLTVFDIESILNIYCYASMFKYISKSIAKCEKDTVEMFYGELADINNIRTIYRCKNNFELESEYIYSYIIPNNYRIKKDDIVKMANSRTKEELKSYIAETPYSKIFAHEFFEKKASRYMYNLSQRLLKLYPYNYVSLSGYFRLKETEIDNIFSVIEGIRYSLPQDKIMSYLVI